MARIASRSNGALLTVLTVASLALTAACVEPFGGSNLQMDFSAATPVPGGADYFGAQAPANTYFTFWALDHQYQVDGDGNIVVDDNNNPVIELTRFYEVQRFEIRPVIDTSSPCFIELEESDYPGLHVTQILAKVQEDTGITDPLNPECDPNECEDEISDVLNAQRRLDLLADLEGDVKAIVTHSNWTYSDADRNRIPAFDLIDDASNAERLRICRELWAEHPEYYEGSDKVFTLPLNGALYGMVEGTNPVNEGFLGGSAMFVDENLEGFDAFSINWQFKDLNDDGAPDYPDPTMDPNWTRDPSDVGYTYMSGTPEHRTRDVISAHLASPYNAATFAEIGIFAGIGEDHVQF